MNVLTPDEVAAANRRIIANATKKPAGKEPDPLESVEPVEQKRRGRPPKKALEDE